MELNRQGATIIYTSQYMEEVEQICSRIVIMDKGKVLAMGSKEALKNMIKRTETITIEVVGLEEEHVEAIKKLQHVYQVDYDGQKLEIYCSGGKHNLNRVLNYFDEKDLPMGRVYSELPTLNDVFLEITGKELRD